MKCDVTLSMHACLHSFALLHSITDMSTSNAKTIACRYAPDFIIHKNPLHEISFELNRFDPHKHFFHFIKFDNVFVVAINPSTTIFDSIKRLSEFCAFQTKVFLFANARNMPHFVQFSFVDAVKVIL